MHGNRFSRAAAGAVLPLLLAAACNGDGRGAASDEPAALETEIAALEQRVERLEDHSAVERLQRAYGYYLDKADWDAIADLMTEDATLEHGLHGVYEGKDSIREFLYALGGGRAGLGAGVLNDHIQLQPVVDVAPDGTTAQGRWRVLGLLGKYGEHARWRTGPYENAYRKVDGQWRISRIHWAETFTVPFEGGPATALDADDEVELELPTPDAPPTFEYTRWPGVALLPFHFNHPVTGSAMQEEGR